MHEKPSRLQYLLDLITGEIVVAYLGQICYADLKTPYACHLKNEFNVPSVVGRGASGYEAYCAALSYLYPQREKLLEAE